MLRYVFRRVLLLVPTLLGVVTLVFIVLRVIPGSPEILIGGDLAQERDLQLIRQQLGLDKPLLLQYEGYLLRLTKGDFGVSFQTRERIADLISSRIGATLELSLVVSLLVTLGVPLGAIAGRFHKTVLDHLILVGGIVGLSVPTFWIALILIHLFGVRWQLLPVSGREGWQSLVMPALSLAIGSTIVVARTVRVVVVEVLQENYIQAARARGLTEGRIVFRHALRGALIPAITLIGLNFGWLLSNSVVIETIFSWPGLGWLLFQSLRYRDFPVIEGVTVVVAALFLIANLVVDVAYAFLDPRIRYA